MATASELELSTYLDPGERLLWWGRPRRGIRLRPHDWFMIPFSMVLAEGIVGGECALVAQAWRNPDLLHIVIPIAYVPLTLFALYLLIGRFVLEARSLTRTHYGLTDKRVLIVGGLWWRESDRLKLETLDEIVIKPNRNGRGTILFGTDKPGAWAGLSRYATPRFDQIEDARQVYEMIRETQRAAVHSRTIG